MSFRRRRVRFAALRRVVRRAPRHAQSRPARGSGVLRAGRLEVAHYGLSVPIPNALMKEIKQRIEEQGKAKPAASR